MDDVFIRYCDMPCSIHSYVVSNSDGTYTIMINDRIGYEMRMLAYQHEIAHIENGDYEKKCCVDVIEINAHKGA